MHAQPGAPAQFSLTANHAENPKFDSRTPADCPTQPNMNAFDATSPTELCDKLRANDVRVPGRTQGRTTRHTETWVTCRFLATVVHANLLRFPLRVEPGDRPDVVLTMPSGPTGIEITEAVPRDEARVDSYSEHKEIADFHFIPRYRVGDPGRSQAEIEKIARGETRILPRMGDSIEHDWVEAMLHFIRRKAASFTKPGFARHPNNWLLIHDNWSPVSALDERVATERLDQHIFGHDTKNPFCNVFVQRPRNILDFRTGSVAVKHSIPDAWLVRLTHR